MRWLNRLSGKYPHPCSVCSSFSKNVRYSIIPPGKGQYFIIPTQNERWKKQGFLEHLPRLRLSTLVLEVLKPLGCSFSQRVQLFIGYRRTSISKIGPHSPILTLAYTLNPHSEIVGALFQERGPRSLNFFVPLGLKSYFFVFKQPFFLVLLSSSYF